MFVVRASVLLLAAALGARAYVDSEFTYQFIVYLDAANAGVSSDPNDFGRVIMMYNPTTMVLSYTLFTTIAGGYTQASLNGPYTCCQVTNNGNPSCNYGYGMNNAYCQYNSGTQIAYLGSGPLYDQSSVTLTPAQEEMLFGYQMYILIRSNPFPNGHLAGLVTYYSYTATVPASGLWSNAGIGMNFVANLVPNTNNLFPNEQASSSSSVGYAYLTFNPSGNTDLGVNIELMTSITEPGAVSMSCPAVGLKAVPIATNGKNPVRTTVNMAPTYVANLYELFLSGHCYLSVVSAAFPNGELFGYIFKVSHFNLEAFGSNEPSNPGNNFMVSCLSDWDLGTKILGFVCLTNITTDSVTSVAIIDKAASNVIMCSVPGVTPTNDPFFPTPTQAGLLTVPFTFFCAINSTFANDVYSNFEMQVYTVGFPGGAVAASMAANTQSLPDTSSGLSQGGKIAIGVIFGLIGFILVGGIVLYVLVRKGIVKSLPSLPTFKKSAAV